MTIVQKIRDKVSASRHLRAQLKTHPGHFHGLVTSYALNLARLRALRLRLRLAGRELVVITLIERMGDIVACEPVARRVRELHPGAFILWAVRPVFPELVEGTPAVDGVLPIHCITEWILLRKLGLFDRAYDLHIDQQFCRSCQWHLAKDEGNTEIDIKNYY